MSAKLLLIDLSSIAHALFHMSGSEPDPDWTARHTVARVHALASGMPSGVAVCIDSPPYFRKAIDPTYKANRTTEHAATVNHQIQIAIDALKADGFPVWGVKGYEADDIIATAVYHTEEHHVYDASTNTMGSPSLLIASADKDLLQLVSDRVSAKSLKDGSLIGPDEVKAKFGVWPHQMVDYLSLVGDSSDNIQGAKSIGAKRAAEILETFGNLEDVYRALDDGQAVLTPSVTASLKDFGLRLTTVRDLIRLRTDAPIPFEDIFKPRVPVVVDDDMAFASDAEETMTDERESGLQAEREPATSPVTREPDRASSADAARQSDVVPDAGDARVGHHEGPAQGATGAPRPGSVGTPPHTALVKQGIVVDALAPMPDDWRHQLEPRSYGQLKGVALDIAASKLFMAYGSAAAVLTTIAAGRELGFHMMASLRAFHIIDGRPCLSAGAIHSLVLTSNKAEFFRCIERTNERATFETKRKGDDKPFALTFTVEDAQRAWSKDDKAWKASGWGKNPADMCVARAITKLARLVYPDVTLGMYAAEEFDSYQEAA